jgi:hypothetical protein|tara:strand:+ start:634 stop:813 length:180 start_codon:yes stop_codon:yes gene_type:complete
MSQDEYVQVRVESLLEKFFEGELTMTETKKKLEALNLDASYVKELVNSTQDAKRDIQKG